MIDLGFSSLFDKQAQEPVVGDKILDADAFVRIIRPQVLDHLLRIPPIDQRWEVSLSHEVLPLVSCGVGLHSEDPSHYVVRSIDGRVGWFLRRSFALAPERCDVSVVTRKRFMEDRREFFDDSAEPILETGVTHIVTRVTVENAIAVDQPMTPRMFVTVLSTNPDEFRQPRRVAEYAKRVRDFWNRFAVVSD